MKSLLLLRHAKSSWSDPGQSDRERPLNKRGRAAAKAIGRFMEQNTLRPCLVKCSPARRTTETLRLVVKQLSTKPVIETDEDLYVFSSGQSYLVPIHATPNDVNSLMLVGHNPTTELLADYLTGEGPEIDRARMSEKFPTCALAVLEFKIDDWQSVGRRGGHLTRFVLPREL